MLLQVEKFTKNTAYFTTAFQPFDWLYSLWIGINIIFFVLVIFQQVQYVDVVLCNRYYAWYQDAGQIQLISRQLEGELRAWFDKFHKPVVQSEYGADTIAGLHMVSLNGVLLGHFISNWRSSWARQLRILIPEYYWLNLFTFPKKVLLQS